MASHCSHSQQQPTTTHTQPGTTSCTPFSLCLCPPILPSSPLLRHVECLLTCGGAALSFSQDRLLWIISPETSLPQRALPWSVSAAAPTSPHLLCLLHVTLSTSPLPRAAFKDTAVLDIMHLWVTEELPACLHTCWQASDITPVRRSGVVSGFIQTRALGICGSKGFFVFCFNTEVRSVFGFEKRPISLDLLHGHFPR